MFRKTFLIISIFSLLFVFSSCSSSSDSSGSSSDTAYLENTAAAVGAIFSSQGSSSVNEQAKIPQKLLNMIVKTANAQQPAETCDHIDEAPDNVTASAQGTTGTYGSANDPVTANTDTSFCQDSDGNDNDDTSGLLFGSFTLSSATITCGSDELTMSGSGIMRNNTTDGYYPEIYGTFTVISGAHSEEVDCNIFLDGNEEIVYSDCTDSDGDDVDTSSDETCTVDAG